jgi:hypothetical protein
LPVYLGFLVVPETHTDGWGHGVIPEHEDPEGGTFGDAYVVAPDGSSAGIVREVGDEPLVQILPPDSGRWGIYAVSFPRPVRAAGHLMNRPSGATSHRRPCDPYLRRHHVACRVEAAEPNPHP